MPSLSIIIPTHRRSEILARCLHHVERQTIADDLEVIVVSDGHDDKTDTLLKKKSWHIPVRFLEIPKSQQGVARNRGITAASAPLVLFIGDDTFLQPDTCEMHVQTHKQLHAAGHKLLAVLGFTTWDPSANITPVMRWLENSGWQFGYPTIAQHAHGFIPVKTQHRFTYTSHVSLPTSVAKRYPFREDVSLYGWEDTEWGMRIRDAGIRLFYEPTAHALHHHHIDLNRSLQRMETLGKSAVHLQKSVPEFDRLPSGWKLLAYRCAALIPTIAGKHRRAFLRGIALGSRTNPHPDPKP